MVNDRRLVLPRLFTISLPRIPRIVIATATAHIVVHSCLIVLGFLTPRGRSLHPGREVRFTNKPLQLEPESYTTLVTYDNAKFTISQNVKSHIAHGESSNRIQYPQSYNLTYSDGERRRERGELHVKLSGKHDVSVIDPLAADLGR